MGDTTDTSFSSEESVGNSPIKNIFPSSRLSTSPNSHPSKLESIPSTHSSSSSSSSKQADGDELEKQLGIKTKYPCEMCGKKVINMKSHVKRMHGEGISDCTVACGQCDRTVLLSCLGQHVMDYHMETERSISPPSPISDVENTDQVIKQAASKNKSHKSQSPVPMKNNKLVPMTCSTSKRPPPQPSSCSSSKQPCQSSVLCNSAVRDLDLVTNVVIDTSSVNHTKHIVLPRLSRMFNTDIVVYLNQNSEQKAANPAGADDNYKIIDDYITASENVNPNVKVKENIQFCLKTQDRDLKGGKSITEVAESFEGRKRRLDRGSKKPYSCCVKELQNTEEKKRVEELQNTEEKKQTHQTVRKLVKSALRGCSVNLRNCDLKIFKDENLSKETDAKDNESVKTDENCNKRELSDLMDSSCPSVSNEEHILACQLNTRNVDTSVKSAFVKPKSKGIKITRTSILFENRTNGFESQEDSTDNASDWFDGNKFSCKKCMFSSTSLNNFSAHVKCYHKTTLAKFSGCYGKTNVQYQCKCCSKKVYNEKSVVKEHVESHLLNLKKYASLYERGRLKKNSDNFLAEFEETLNPNCSPSVHQDPSQTYDTQSSSPPSPPTADLPPSNEVTSSHDSDSADKFVYICPFHGCDFQTDLQGMKDGPAAEHGIAVHQVRPWEVKKHGLKWKRISREKRKRKVCGGD